MDIEKLIEAVKLCGSTPKVDQCKKCTYWAGGDMSKCIPRMTEYAATALSTLQAENAELRAEVKHWKSAYHQAAINFQQENRECNKALAELEQAKRENETLKHALQNWHEED